MPETKQEWVTKLMELQHEIQREIGCCVRIQLKIHPRDWTTDIPADRAAEILRPVEKFEGKDALSCSGQTVKWLDLDNKDTGRSYIVFHK